jgi:anaerobic selenocysteine-containing dehydrogenase
MESSIERRVRGTCPLDCPDTCSWIVTVKDGEALTLRGDPEHPVTRGALCNKVAHYLAYTRSPERVLYPMRRRGPKGGGRFERVSWDDALSEIASRFRAIVDTWGATGSRSKRRSDRRRHPASPAALIIVTTSRRRRDRCP